MLNIQALNKLSNIILANYGTENWSKMLIFIITDFELPEKFVKIMDLGRI